MKQIACPKCCQFKVMSVVTMMWAGWIACTMIAVFLFWLPIISIPAVIIGIGFFVGGIVGPFIPKMRDEMICNNCHYRWNKNNEQTKVA